MCACAGCVITGSGHATLGEHAVGTDSAGTQLGRSWSPRQFEPAESPKTAGRSQAWHAEPAATHFMRPDNHRPVHRSLAEAAEQPAGAAEHDSWAAVQALLPHWESLPDGKKTTYAQMAVLTR
eukprot:350521-Chlamydomonas_euryale.AAC.15